MTQHRFAAIVRGLVLVCLVLGLFAASAFAGGFSINEFSARGNALGGTLIGRADDPSAVYFNPAGITQLEGTQIQAGGSAISPNADLTTTNPYTGETEHNSSFRRYWLAPHLYLTHKLNDRVSLGFGVFSRFGLGNTFESDWPGRYNNYSAVVQSVSLNPNVAFKVTDKLSMAVGLEGMWFDLNLKRMVDGGAVLAAQGYPVTVNDSSTDTYDVDTVIDGSGIDFGYNFALHYTLNEHVKFGATYRGQLTQDLAGEVDFDRPDSLTGAIGEVLFNSSSIHGTITLPDVIGVGVALSPNEKISFEADVLFYRWSTFDELTIKYDDLSAVGSEQSSTEKDWRDTFRFQFGLEYKPVDWLALRGSYVFDQTPIPDGHEDYLVPGDDYHIFGAGVGFLYDRMTLDLSYNYLYSPDRTVEMRLEEGVYDSIYQKNTAHIFGFTLGYTF